MTIKWASYAEVFLGATKPFLAYAKIGLCRGIVQIIYQ